MAAFEGPQRGAFTAEQAAQLRHPWHDRIIYISTAVTLVLMTVAVVAIVLLVTGRIHFDELSDGLHQLFAVAIALVVVVPGVLVFTRGTAASSPRAHGVSGSEKQFAELTTFTRHYARLAGLERVPEVVMMRGADQPARSVARLGRSVICVHTDLVEAHRPDGDQAALRFALAREIGLLAAGERTFASQFFSVLTQVTPYLSRVAARAEDYTADLWGAALAPDAAADYFSFLAVSKVLWPRVNLYAVAGAAGRGGISETLTTAVLDTPPLPWRVRALAPYGVFQADNMRAWQEFTTRLRTERAESGHISADSITLIRQMFARADFSRRKASFWRRPHPLPPAELAAVCSDMSVAKLIRP